MLVSTTFYAIINRNGELFYIFASTKDFTY